MPFGIIRDSFKNNVFSLGDLFPRCDICPVMFQKGNVGSVCGYEDISV